MKFRLYRQLEAMDCGPTCIQMVAFHFGKRISLSRIKEHTIVTRMGVTIKDIVSMCKAIGLKAIPIRIYEHELDQLPMPALLFWKQSHCVVLYNIRNHRQGRRFCIADPGSNKLELEEEVFRRVWMGENDHGIAILVEPTEAFYVQPSDPKQTFAVFTRFIRFIREAFLPHRKQLIGVGLLSAAVLLSSWVIPIFLQKAIDFGIGEKNLHVVLALMFGQLFFFIGNSVAGYVNNILLTKIGFTISVKFLSRYLHKLIRLPIAFFDTKLNADLIQRMEDQRKLENVLTNSLTSVSIAFATTLVYGGMLLYYSPYAFGVFLLFNLLNIWHTRRSLGRLVSLNYAKFTISSDNRNNIQEMIDGMSEIKINSAQQARIHIWEEIQHKENRISLKGLYLGQYFSAGLSFVQKLSEVLIIIVCAYLVIGDVLTIGVMMTIMYIIGALSSSTLNIYNFTNTLQEARLSMERLDNIYRMEDEDTDAKVAPQTFLVNGLELRNASFKYSGSHNPYVLNHIDLLIPVGKVTAIVGVSGSGKTTLMKLLLSFYYPQEGDVYLDDMKLSSINGDLWRRRCGVVMQDGMIFSGTIAENIAFADEKPDIERVKEAARIACIDSFIDRLPLHYNTKIGKVGTDLSGGQKQRILIARAVYKNPDFIFFDEATSSLDANNEKAIMENLTSFYQGKTVVIIAHRLSTVSSADNIVYMDNGRIIEQGSHKYLTEQKGSYYHLIRNQLELGM